ncbi:MAG TPA: OmpA family protein [Paludibacter sp.]|nr:OmpA family protein [Paludibacter sp.]
MKKLFFAVLLIAGTIMYTFSQTTTDAAHWSFALKGGVDYFNIEPSGDDLTDNGSWGAGASLEYTINPLVGVGLNLDWLNFNRSSIMGKTIDPSIFTSINLSNLLIPRRENAKLNFYANFGTGVGFGSYSDLVLPTTTYPRVVASSGNVTSALAYTGLAMEYNVSKLLGIGLESTYRGYITPKTNYLNYNDCYTIAATLRVKLGTGSKTHVRDMTRYDYYPDPVPVIKEVENNYDDSGIIKRLDGIDKFNQDILNRLNKMDADVKSLKDRPAGSTVNASFPNIEFDFNSSKITKDSYSTLDQIASILKKNPTWGKLLIKGYTDNIGSNAYNMKLSEERATSVKNYLESKGVTSSTMITDGLGESQPIAPNEKANDTDNPKGRQDNRRVEFEISK